MRKCLFTKSRIAVLCADLASVIVFFACKPLTEWMLQGESICYWELHGLRCLTCGGTHFVNALADGRILDAFHYNPFLFITAVSLLLSWILVHLYVLFRVQTAKKILSKVYSFPGMIVALSLMIVFLFVRNVPLVIRLFEPYI